MIVLGKSKLDEDTDGITLASYSPAMSQFLDEVQEERAALDAMPGRAKGMTKLRMFQKIAMVPEPVMAFLELVNGIDWMYNGGFMRWLRRHPEYTVGRTLIQKDVIR